MTGTGTVKKVLGKYIEVTAPTESECSSCALQESCSNNSLKDGQTILVINTVGAEVGDYVEFEFSSKDVNRGLFIVYGIPLIFIVLGTILGSILEYKYNIKLLNLKDFTVFLTTITSLLIGVVIVRILDKKEEPHSYTTKIISKEFIKGLEIK